MESKGTIDIGGRRELFVDDYLIETRSEGASLQLHSPTPREVVLVTDRPWEGALSNNFTIFRDGDICRMYYLGWNVDLSQLRADAVRQWLVDRGIDAGRIRSVGYGPDRPAASNATPAGKAKNRRVELSYRSRTAPDAAGRAGGTP